MRFVLIILLSVASIHISQTAVAAGNNGDTAGSCLSVSENGSEMSFSNLCSHRIFIIYCGDLLYSGLSCGSGPNGGYYTHSRNLDAGDVFLVERDGQISFGGCSGGIGFGNKAYNDNNNGDYSCNVLD